MITKRLVLFFVFQFWNKLQRWRIVTKIRTGQWFLREVLQWSRRIPFRCYPLPHWALWAVYRVDKTLGTLLGIFWIHFRCLESSIYCISYKSKQQRFPNSRQVHFLVFNWQIHRWSCFFNLHARQFIWTPWKREKWELSAHIATGRFFLPVSSREPRRHDDQERQPFRVTALANWLNATFTAWTSTYIDS